MIGASGTLLFFFAAAFAVVGALGTVLAKRPLRSALFLFVHLVSLAMVYLTLNAELLAAVQVLVYVGAVVVLFVFVIMLLGAGTSSPPAFRAIFPRTLAATLMATLTLTLAALLGSTVLSVPEAPEGFGSVEAIAEALFRGAIVPFELVAVVLTVAVLAVIGIARGRTAVEEAAAAREPSGEEAN